MRGVFTCVYLRPQLSRDSHVPTASVIRELLPTDRASRIRSGGLSAVVVTVHGLSDTSDFVKKWHECVFPEGNFRV